MGKPGHNTKVSEGTAEEGFGPSELEILSPLTYQGRGGGNPDSPANTGIDPDPKTGVHGGPIKPRDPLGILDTIPGGEEARGKRGGAY